MVGRKAPQSRANIIRDLTGFEQVDTNKNLEYDPIIPRKDNIQAFQKDEKREQRQKLMDGAINYFQREERWYS